MTAGPGVAPAPAAGPDPDALALLRVVAAVAARPALWPTAVRQAALLARPGWWRSSPHLPVPDAAYLRFRVQTAYGGTGRPPDPGDVVAWLRWCGQMRRLSRAG